MSLEAKDPLDWTVDDVVNFLCHTTETPWSKSVVRNRPDPTVFEAILRDNFITGEALLHDVDAKNLNEDLGIRPLGHRSSVLRAIQYLRERSSKYLSTQGHLRNQFEDYYNGSSVPSYLEKITTPHPGIQTPQHRNDRAIFSNQKDQPSFSPGLVQDAQDISDNRNDNEPQVFSSDNTHGETDNHVISRPNESVVVDSKGRKCRRLQLSPQPREAYSKDASPELALDKEWYMGPQKTLASQLFYPFTSDDDDQSFVLLGGNFPLALRSFVNNSLQYSYRQRPIRLRSKKGKQYWGVLPCKPLNEENQKYFTLYTKHKGKVTVRQEETRRWPELNTTKFPADTPPSSSDPFAYLLHKYPAEDDNIEKALPAYGDSGSEGEYDEETWEEINNEKQDPDNGKFKKLSLPEVDGIINDRAIEIENEWHETKKHREETGARKLWLRAKRERSVNRQIKAIAQDIQLQELRLRKVQSTIRGNDYYSEQELFLVCQTMEYPIFNIAKQKWRIMVLEQEQCPPQIGPVPEKQARPKKRPMKNDDEEELLSSESDFIYDDFTEDSAEPMDFSFDNQSGPSTDIPATRMPERQHLLSDSSCCSSDEDVISPSGKARGQRRRRQYPLSLHSSPSVTANDKPETEMVDLTRDTPPPDDFMIETPPLNPISNKNPVRNSSSTSANLLRNSISPPPKLGARVSVEIPNPKADMPSINDFAALEKLDWAKIKESSDKSRLLAKLVGSLPDEERKSIFDMLPNYGVKRLRNYVRSNLKALFQGQGKIEGLSALKTQLIMRMAVLFVSYVNCTPLSQEVMSRHQIVNAQMDLSGFTYFFGLLSQILEAHHDWKNAQGEPEASNTPHKKRKKEVKESLYTKMNQENAQERVLLQELQKEKLQKSWENMGISNDDPRHQAVSFGDPVIYLHEHNGTRVMPHQLDGIQFMWRELIQDDSHQGCLLAHTMGLGKTMQIVSFLSTVYLTVSASDERTRNQVPKHLHRSQTLILCPSSLIDNWFEEFCMWTPPSNPLGPLRKVTAATKPDYRLQGVEKWNREGGVLILSYTLFRMWILNKESKRRGKQPIVENDSDQDEPQDSRKCLSKEDHERVRDWLLNGPRIIVADEAHTMKNPSTGIYQATKQFRSKSRIALTGSPLANNLVDYYTMLDWIANGYLGEFKEFKAKYVEPIEEGLYADSTYAERRRSLVRLQVLKEILEPKVNRADITALAGHLPPKVEFVITVPLTRLQEEAYNLYVDCLSAGASDVGTAKLWSWLAILGLCCNHPSCFWDKLNNRANYVTASQSQDLDKDDITPGDESIEQAGLPDSSSLLFREKPLFAAVDDINATHLSYRVLMLDKIICESVKAGDKILVFSHSIPTLDYLEDVLVKSNRKCCRLDGSTRPSDRQAATKTFNKSGGEQVYLISTRAGGLGLNIPGANRVIIFDFQFNPVWEEQAVGRVYRLGQQKPVFVYRFISGGTYEEKIFDRAIFKTHLATRVVDKKNPIRFASKAMSREYLRPATSVSQKDLSEFIGKDPFVLDKIIRDDNGPEKMIRKITLTETFQKEDNDKLTEEERKGVEMHLNDERLKRANPQAYQELLHRRDMDLAAEQSRLIAMQSQSYHHDTYKLYTHPTSASHYQQQPEPPLQFSHNVGPRPLPPDTTASRPAVPPTISSNPFINMPPNRHSPSQPGPSRSHPLPPRPPVSIPSSPQIMPNASFGTNPGVVGNEKPV